MNKEAFNRYMNVLYQTEWAQPHELARYQDGLLTKLISHAYENAPFYHDRLACLFEPDGSLDLSRWREVPVLTRAEAISGALSMRSGQLDELHGDITELRTSGSSGEPLSFASNQLVTVAANAAMTRLADWWGADISHPLARIRFHKQDAPRYPEGRHSKGWSYAAPEADTHDLDLLVPVDQQIEWLLRINASYLMTHPSNAVALAYAATPEQVRNLGIEIIFTIGETVLPRTREIIAERLGSRTAAIYSCQEIGCIATQCPMSPAYHVVAENALVEILREDGSSAAPGEVGQVVLTSFYNYATPFIRYAIGDIAVLSEEPCRCGRELPVIAQVLGRTRCAFIFEDGTRVWPRAWHGRDIRKFVPCREFQIVQLDHRQIEYRYVPDGSDQPPDHVGVHAYVRKTIHPTAEIRLVPMESIPRGPGGKLDPFVSMVME